MCSCRRGGCSGGGGRWSYVSIVGDAELCAVLVLAGRIDNELEAVAGVGRRQVSLGRPDVAAAVVDALSDCVLCDS